MSEFVNVTEVEKLPLDRIDSLVAIDPDKNIKRTSIIVDQELVEDSINPISSKGVFDALEELRGDVGVTVEDVETEIQNLDDDITDLRDELIDVNDKFDNYYVQDQVYNKTQIDVKLDDVNQKFEDYYTYNLVYTKADIDSMLSDYTTFNYIESLIGNINAVLDQINGEEV